MRTTTRTAPRGTSVDLGPAARAAAERYLTAHRDESLVLESPCSAPSFVHFRSTPTVVGSKDYTEVGRVGRFSIYGSIGQFGQCPHDAIVIDLIGERDGRPLLLTRPKQVWDPCARDERGDFDEKGRRRA